MNKVNVHILIVLTNMSKYRNVIESMIANDFIYNKVVEITNKEPEKYTTAASVLMLADELKNEKTNN